VERKNGVIKKAVYAKVTAIMQTGATHWDIRAIVFAAVSTENNLMTHRHGFTPLQLLRGKKRDMMTPIENLEAVYAEVSELLCLTCFFSFHYYFFLTGQDFAVKSCPRSSGVGGCHSA
jgi:hypothetical protein